MLSKKTLTRLSALGLAISILSATSGCSKSGPAKENGQANDSKKPVTIDWYFEDAFTASPDNDVAKEIEKQTGVKINVIAGSPDKSKVMLASGDVYDLNFVTNENIPTVLTNKLALPIDELLQSNGQNIMKYHEKPLAIYKKYKSGEDGKQYFLPILNGNPTGGKVQDFQANLTSFYTRWDYYKEAGAPEVNTLDDFIGVLAKIQKAHPTTKDGKPVYGISGWQDWGLWNFATQFAYPNGMKDMNVMYNQTPNDDLEASFTDSNSLFWKAAEFYYKANKAGILDPDFFINKYDNYMAKAKAGQFLTVPAFWQPDEIYAGVVENSANADAKLASYIALPIPGDFGYNNTYVNESYIGTNGVFQLFIGKECKSPERAMDLLNYTFSPEGSRTIFSGVKGTQWDVIDGKPAIKPEALEAQKNDKNFLNNTGINAYQKLAGFLPQTVSAVDKAPMDLLTYGEAAYASRNNAGYKDFSDKYGVSVPGELFTKLEKEGKLKVSNATPEMKTVMPTIPNDIKKITADIEDYVKKNVAKAVLAKSDAEFSSAKESMIADIKKMGSETADKWWMENWNKIKGELKEILK